MLKLEGHGALSVDDVEVVVRRERNRFGHHRCGTRFHVFQLRANLQSTHIERRRLAVLRGVARSTLVTTRSCRVHWDAVHACSFFDLLHVRNYSSPWSAAETYVACESDSYHSRGRRCRRAAALQLRVFRSAGSWRWQRLGLQSSRETGQQAPCYRC